LRRNAAPRLEPSSGKLDPYEVAYLAGGPKNVMTSAIAKLLNDEHLDLKPPGYLDAAGKDLPPGVADMEKIIHGQVRRSPLSRLDDLLHPLWGAFERISSRLRQEGYLFDESDRLRHTVLPSLLPLCVILLGVIKILVGMTRNRPVFFLVVLCGVSLFLVYRFMKSDERTPAGIALVDRLRKENAAMEYQASWRFHELSGEDVVLATGLFGTGILVGGPFAMLDQILHPPRKHGGGDGGSDGGGVGCSSGGCGGGCGGGGCGGCGG
jgi:uncharacterized protein (TIGR04222 family)